MHNPNGRYARRNYSKPVFDPSLITDANLVRFAVEAALHGNDFTIYTDEIRTRSIAEITEQVYFSNILTDECTCTPLDGGLGATTCPACKAQAGSNQLSEIF